jgi:hypothetical protein
MVNPGETRPDSRFIHLLEEPQAFAHDALRLGEGAVVEDSPIGPYDEPVTAG